jgi:hypothetical protein
MFYSVLNLEDMQLWLVSTSTGDFLDRLLEIPALSLSVAANQFRIIAMS